MARSVGGDLEHAQIVRPGAVLGSVSSAWTAGPAAIAATGVSVTAWPGTPVTVTVTPRPLAHAISLGQPVADTTVTIGSQVNHITLDASQSAPAPSMRWLFTRLRPALNPRGTRLRPVRIHAVPLLAPFSPARPLRSLGTRSAVPSPWRPGKQGA